MSTQINTHKSHAIKVTINGVFEAYDQTGTRVASNDNYEALLKQVDRIGKVKFNRKAVLVYSGYRGMKEGTLTSLVLDRIEGPPVHGRVTYVTKPGSLDRSREEVRLNQCFPNDERNALILARDKALKDEIEKLHEAINDLGKKRAANAKNLKPFEEGEVFK